eukprot:c28399_g1_i2 orf=163-2601(+)
MGGQVQQPNTAPHYDHHGVLHNPGHAVETGDAVMARWLQSAGLQHLASPAAAPTVDPRFLPNLLMQDYSRHGVQSMEDKQKLYRLIKSMSSGAEPPSEQWTPPLHSSSKQNGVDGLASPELRGEMGSGILDLHSIDDIELLSEDSVPEPFEASPFVPVIGKGYDNETDLLWSMNKPQLSRQSTNNDISPMRPAFIEKESNSKESGVARIKVVVRKRPLNKKEMSRKEDDIVTVDTPSSSLTVHEPKLKVDLTAYVEKHDFTFDAVLDYQVSNDEVYRVTVEPIIPLIFQRTKATCFAYGQTGSGKTYTMQPLPLRACEDILHLMQYQSHRNQGLQLWLSFFEIYGGKLYDLLNDRRKLCMREDGRQQVCIVGLREFPVSDVHIVTEYIEKGNAARSTGTTGANEESSRSHAILQLVIKKHNVGKDEKGGRMVGKFSFIDLAGSERGADTTDNDRQTRIEGAEINKSLLALKECIRALDHEQVHIPFRGSKLTEVLRDSFVGDSRTVMISCISPNAGSCEHTLNTLRYADRVKGLSRNNNSKRDPSPGTTSSVPVPVQRESAGASPTLMSPENSENTLSSRAADDGKQPPEWNQHMQHGDGEQQFTSLNRGVLKREDSKASSFLSERGRSNVRETSSNSFNTQCDIASAAHSLDRNDHGRDSPPRRKVLKDDKNTNFVQKADEKIAVAQWRQMLKDEPVYSLSQSRQRESADVVTLENGYDEHITAILEEEEDLIAAHRLEVEDSMELVREEMKLLSEVDQPGSLIDCYVSQLSYVLSRKAAGIVNLQARLARFQRHLKEQEILGRNMCSRHP